MTPVHAPDALACNYIEFTVDTSAHGISELILDGTDIASWALSSIGSKPGLDTAQTIISMVSENLKLQLPFIDDYEHMIAIPTVISRSALANPYVLQSRVLPYGDANYDGTVNVGDAVYLVNYIFRSGPVPAPVIESGDANCSGSINVADAVTVINYVFHGGPEPCAGR